MHIWLKRLGATLATFLALGLAAWLGAPPLLGRLLAGPASEALGRPVSAARIDFRPWSLELTVEGLRIGAAPGTDPAAAPLLEVTRVHADADLRSLWHRAPVLASLTVDGPALNLTRTADGHYDIDDLIARLGAADPAPADAEPARFALHNLQVRDGRVRFDDRPLGRVHQMEQLAFALPFLSNLPADLATEVTPRLAFTLDGAAFDSQAQSRPFAPGRHTRAQFRLPDLDLAPWLGHWPQALPLRPLQGRLSADLTLAFETPEGGSPAVTLSGRIGARDLALADGQGRRAVGWTALEIPLREVQPLARRVALGAVTLDGLDLVVARDAQGRIGPASAQADAAPAPAPASAPASAAAPAPWSVAIDGVTLRGAGVSWEDATTRPAARLRLDGLELAAGPVAWPMQAPVPVRASAALAAPARGRISVRGEAGDVSARLDIGVEDLALAAAEPYLAGVLRPRLEGALSLQGTVEWAPGRLAIALAQAAVEGPRLVGRDAAAGAPPLLALDRLQVTQAAVDLTARKVRLGTVRLERPQTRLARDERGALNAAAWTAPAPATAAPPEPAPPWRLDLGALEIRDGRLGWTDAQPQDDVQVDLDRLQVTLHDVALQGPRLLAPLRWQASAELPAGAGGRVRRSAAVANPALEGRGTLALEPLALAGTLRLQAVPLHALEPYFGEALGVHLTRARLGYQGELALADGPQGLAVTARGDGRLGDVQVRTRRAAGVAAGDADELLSWQTLTLAGLDLALRPAQRPRVALREVTLDDFYARLMITEDGRFNLQDVGAARPPAEAASAPPPAASAAPVASAAGPAIDLTVGATRLSRGRVDFSDRFIRPNYSADITELEGTLGTLRTGTRDTAEIALRGRVARTGQLDIAGRVNPMARPPALDVRARATDLELTPLSPYAGKYAGYGIERGKLSMDVTYRIGGDGRLDASNRLVLNQLTFGERVESPDATKLPVLLAVALLKDRHGVIDLDIPVSGSLDDPQFSVTGLVFKVIGNLLTKALTAPFALLSGGGDDLGRIAFEPGRATPAADGRATLDKVASSLADRPALTVTVAGLADREAERAAWQAAALERRLQALHRREQARAAGRASGDDEDDDAAQAIPDDERARLLKLLASQRLRAARPAAAASAPPPATIADLSAALREAEPVTEADWRALAQQRAEAVRDALLARQVGNERVFLAAPRVQAGGAGDAGGGLPRAELTLSAR